MNAAHIVFSNDSPEAVFLGSLEQAEKIRDRLRQERYERDRYQFESFAVYCKICYWHIHTVPVVEK